jgi:hypothetical protein
MLLFSQASQAEFYKPGRILQAQTSALAVGRGLEQQNQITEFPHAYMLESTYHEHDIVRRVSRQPRYRSPEIFLMSGQVDEGDELRRVLADLLRRVALVVVHRVSLGVKAEQLMRDGRRPAGLDLVQVPEHV